MNKLYKSLPWLILSCCLTYAQAQEILIQRTTGAAPMGTHITVNITNWDSLSQHDYEWHFPNGDTSIGYQLVYTFEESGWLKLKTTNLHNIVTWDSIYITVIDPNDAYPMTNTICISSSGDFDGCPTGAVQITITNLNTLNFEPNKRYLFRNDDSFQLSISKSIGAGTQLSAYGSSTQKPKIIIDGDATHTVFWMNDSININNLHFYGKEWVSSSAWGTSLFGEGRLFAPENHTNMYNVDVTNMTSFAIMDDGIGARNNLVVDKVNATNLGSYFIYSGPSPSMQYSGIKACNIYNVLSNHGIRMNGGKWFSVHDTHIDSVDRSQITFRGLRYGLISDSKFTGKALYKNSVRNIWDDASTADSVMYILFERNVYHTSGNEFGIDLNIGKHMLIRNNIFINAALNVGQNLAGVIPQDIDIYHNTFYNNHYDWYATITLRANGSGNFKGNIVYVNDCLTSDCLSQNPFAAHSSRNPSHWNLDYNAYYKTGDASGTHFQESLNFEAWKALGWESNSSYVPISFINPSTIIEIANFQPTLGDVLNQVPFMTHRDYNKKIRLSSIAADMGAVEDETILNAESLLTNPLSIYPNPASQSLFVNYEGNIHSISIYNILGQCVSKMNFTGNRIDISSLKLGNYILEITNEQGIKKYISFVKDK